MLDVVIVNFRTPELTVDCLRSLEPEIRQVDQVRVWIVENCSGDRSAQILSDEIAKNGWNSWGRLLISDRNLGFAGGNNLAIREALKESSTKLVWLLNPDTVVRPGGMVELLKFMELNPQVGIGGSRLEYADGKIQYSAFRFPTWKSELEHSVRARIISRIFDQWIVTPPQKEQAHHSQWVSGASMIIRREVFDNVGLLDDRYFMYFEELDFCFRAAKAGWPCWYVPQSRVVHLYGQSSGVTKEPRKRKPTYWFAARRRFFLKNYGRVATLVADLAWTVGFAIYRVGAFLRGRKPYDPVWMWWDFVRYNFGVQGLLFSL
ncbi:MAG TPA: glycosyltransferase family 2 protein [Tepidisphaeraceae bacterium]